MNSIWGMYNKYSIHNLKNNQSLSPDENGEHMRDGYNVSALSHGEELESHKERSRQRTCSSLMADSQKRDASPPPPAGFSSPEGGYFSSLVGSLRSQFH